MAQTRGNRGKKTSNYDFIFIDEVQQFDMEEYVQNPAMIRKLHAERNGAYSAIVEQKSHLEAVTLSLHQMELLKRELELRLHEASTVIAKLADEKEALDGEVKGVKLRIEAMTRQNHELELQRQALDLKLNHTQQKLSESNQTSLTRFATSTAAAIILGFGVNVVTSSPSDWRGWVIIASSVVLGVIAFFIPRKGE
ncbi:MAG: hypothetical protein ACRDIV_20480 [Ktedonobacteraceae bacterium]